MPSTRILIRRACWMQFGLILLAVANVQAQKSISFAHENVLGTSLEIEVICGSPEEAREVESEVLRELDRLNDVLSEYKPTSEFSKWQATLNQPMAVSAELLECFQLAESFQSLTHDAFHPGAGQLTRRWNAAAEADRPPSSDQLADDVKTIHQPLWKIDRESGTVTRLVDIPVSLNAMAKGFVIDKVGEKIMERSHPPRSLMINIGGDLRCWGKPAADPSWTIDIENPLAASTQPLQQVVISNQALATSGNQLRGFDIQGKHYSHIIAPQNGMPVDQIAGVSVIAPSAAMADALATAFATMNISDSLEIAEKLPNCACLVIDETGKRFPSRKWAFFQAASKPASPTAATDRPTGNPAEGKELAIDFEIRKQGQGSRFRRPYVAVWIESADGFPVRTLVLWLMEERPGPRWHRNLTRWYSSDQMRLLVDETELIGTISSATRPAGKYKTLWDGKDDQGKPCQAGKYTLYIEAAREHGTYQLIKFEFEHGGNVFTKALEGNREIESASLNYRSHSSDKTDK